MCALARTSENEFIFLGGDVAHHAGEFRSTVHVPLPGEITRLHWTVTLSTLNSRHYLHVLEVSLIESSKKWNEFRRL